MFNYFHSFIIITIMRLKISLPFTTSLFVNRIYIKRWRWDGKEVTFLNNLFPAQTEEEHSSEPSRSMSYLKAGHSTDLIQ